MTLRTIPISVGVLLLLGGAAMLFVIFGLSTLAAGALDEDSPEWWPTVLGGMFGAPETFLVLAGMLGGVGLCLHRPGRKMTAGRRAALAGALAILLALFLQAAARERECRESRLLNPDGTMHVSKEYRNWFGWVLRTVEADEP